jgi:general stress protein 26
MPENKNISKVTDIINDSQIGMFTTINEQGALVSRPLAVQDVKNDGDMWFFSVGGSGTVEL